MGSNPTPKPDEVAGVDEDICPEILWSTVTVGVDSDDETALEDTVPAALIDALVDTAWAHPGLRVGFARIDNRAATFLATAGAKSLPNLAGRTIALSGKLLSSLGNDDRPLAIEDTQSDDRTRAVKATLEQTAAGAMLMLGVRCSIRRTLCGVVTLDARKPRTWGRDERSTLERLVPLAAVALDNEILREELERTRSSLLDMNRRLGARRSVLAAIAHDGDRVLDTLAHLTDRQSAEAALVRRLEELFDEIDGLLVDRTSRPQSPVDLWQLAVEHRALWQTLLGPRVSLALSRENNLPFVVVGYPPGLQRMLSCLMTLIGDDWSSTASRSVRMDLERSDGIVEVRLEIEGLDDEAALLRLKTSDDFDLDVTMWLVRSELIFAGGQIAISPMGEQLVISIRLPS